MKEVFRVVWGTVWAALILISALLLLCKWFSPFLDSILTDSLSSVKQDNALLADTANEQNVILLDPGHGGEDPGAIGADGVLEKDLNLSTALRLRDLLVFGGYKVIMTREDDRLLYDPAESDAHKVQDLKNRLAYVALYPTSTFVSLHMNKFPDEDCSGLQVYYSGNREESELLAQTIQTLYGKALPNAKIRACKQATSAIFILHRIEIPAVLVECGFLSNPTENALLQDAEYQKKIAAVIAIALEESPNQMQNASEP